VVTGIENRILDYESEKKDYQKVFEEITKKNKMVKILSSIPGIGLVGSITIASTVIEAKRFNMKSKFLVYSGLLKLDRMSGGRSYGKFTPRYNRRLKKVFKTAAIVIINRTSEDNLLRRYYEHLIIKKNYPDYQARHALAQRLAVLSLGIMRSGKKYNEKLIKRKYDGLAVNSFI